MHVSNVSRASGSSSCASLSYIASMKVRDDRAGETYYGFGRRERVMHVGTLLPEGAPAGWRDPAELFNSIELHERAANARPAKKIMVALPREFDLATQREVVEEFISRNLTAEGYAATYAIHCDSQGGNPHAHILVANRQIDPKTGGWAKTKARKEWALDERGERIPVIDPETGRQKVDARNRRQWKRVTVQSNPLDAKAKLQTMREDWATVCNKRLTPEQAIDHRSLEAQGSDHAPTKHEGYAAREIEKRGKASPICEWNREVRRQNGILDRLRAEFASVTTKLTRAIEAVKAKFAKPEPAPAPAPEPTVSDEQWAENWRAELTASAVAGGKRDRAIATDQIRARAVELAPEAGRAAQAVGARWDELKPFNDRLRDAGMFARFKAARDFDRKAGELGVNSLVGMGPLTDGAWGNLRRFAMRDAAKAVYEADPEIRRLKAERAKADEYTVRYGGKGEHEDMPDLLTLAPPVMPQRQEQAPKAPQRPEPAPQPHREPSKPQRPAEPPRKPVQATQPPSYAPQEPPKPIRTKKALTDRFKTRLDERLAENERKQAEKQAEPDMEETWDLSDPADPLNIGMGWGTGGHGLGL